MEKIKNYEENCDIPEDIDLKESKFLKKYSESSTDEIEIEEDKNWIKDFFSVKSKKSCNYSSNKTQEKSYVDPNDNKIVNLDNSHIIHIDKFKLHDPIVLIREKHKRKSLLVNKIQSSLIGWYFRLKFFSSVKKLLIVEQNKLFDKLKKKFDNQSLYDLEKFNKLTYDSNGWKKFYTDSEYNFKNLIFERSFFTKIFVGIDDNEKLFFYTGYLNRHNIKNGKGTLFFEDSKQEGCWLNDKLIGWCRIINNDGYLIDGKIKFIF